MPLSDPQKTQIQDGFARLRHAMQPASLAFYEAFFRRRPDLRPMFRDDLAGQGMRFMATLGLVVDALDTPEMLADRLAELGRGHAALGVQAEHFAPMGEALIETLQAEFGPEFTPEAEAAWRAAYAEVARQLVASGHLA
ncbi:globin [Frigidibacter albus]|uniref:Globin n=1 Tax=Frigidibacter albus TaxID=1465486 RepID=A0A6L8VG09_9RHOB|nr:globin domain-containing protein [Frigidibacter albus]MZQ88170.1 globin [Frigidibacter albus]NBE30156.1 globin [Frigidibacter albus]GGH47066.1 hypothetical protein GCM10011341_07930 [Frigidibacter albus]